MTFCSSPWFNRWQQALSRDLMSANARPLLLEFHSEKLVVSHVLQRFQTWNTVIV